MTELETFLDGHGVPVVGGGPVVVELQKNFADELSANIRQRFLTALKRGVGVKYSEAAKSSKQERENAIAGMLTPEYGALAQFMAEQVERPYDMLTGEPILTESEREGIAAIAEAEPQAWREYLLAAKNDALTAYWAFEQDRLAEAVNQKREQEAVAQRDAQVQRLMLGDAGRTAEVIHDAERLEEAGREQLEAQERYPTDAEVVAPAMGKSLDLSVADGQRVETAPSDAQKEAGNYKMAHVKLGKQDVTIENPVGSVRSGKDGSGKAWSQEMRADYGYIKGTMGYDKDHLDVFVDPQPSYSDGSVYVVNQVDPKTGKFDEHKVMIGAVDEDRARELYLSNYEEGWQGLGSIARMSRDAFEEWAFTKGKKGPQGGAVAGVLPSTPVEKSSTKVKGVAPTTRAPRKWRQYRSGTGLTKVIDAVVEAGGIIGKTKGKRSVGRALGGEYDQAPALGKLGAFARSIYGDGHTPDAMAQALYDAGVLPEPSADLLWTSIVNEIENYRDARDRGELSPRVATRPRRSGLMSRRARSGKLQVKNRSSLKVQLLN